MTMTTIMRAPRKTRTATIPHSSVVLIPEVGCKERGSVVLSYSAEALTHLFFLV